MEIDPFYNWKFAITCCKKYNKFKQNLLNFNQFLDVVKFLDSILNFHELFTNFIHFRIKQ